MVAVPDQTTLCRSTYLPQCAKHAVWNRVDEHMHLQPDVVRLTLEANLVASAIHHQVHNDRPTPNMTGSMLPPLANAEFLLIQ